MIGTSGLEELVGSMSIKPKPNFVALNEPGDPNEVEQGLPKHRSSLERYKPGAYHDEDREQHRRIGNFEENRLPNENPDRVAKRGGRNKGRGRGSWNNRNRVGKAEVKSSTSGEARPRWVQENEMEEPRRRNWADESFEEPTFFAPQEQDKENESEKRTPPSSDGGVDLRHKLNEKRRHQREGVQQQQSKKKSLPRPKKNTKNFNPNHDPPEMRILCAPSGLNRYHRPYGSRDVAVVTDLFVDEANDLRIYDRLLKEIRNGGIDERHLWQSWHGDSHLIADDKRHWKKACPTFSWIVDRLADYFQMNVQATRLNWYRNSSEWKPFHHDAAAVKPNKAKTQNMTVAVSFGSERDVAFEHAKTQTVISMPQPNGTVYTFGRDVNILWRHGIPQLPPDRYTEEGRISIIVWGWNQQFDM